MYNTQSSKFKLVLVSRFRNGRVTVTIKASANNKVSLKKELDRLNELAWKFGRSRDYRICGPVQFKKLQAEVDANRDSRRKAGVKKSAKTRAKNAAKGVKPHFICCPKCNAKSKKLYSEMGGLQTRKCQNGHIFEYDKWIADRAFWGVVLGGRVPDPFRA